MVHTHAQAADRRGEEITWRDFPSRLQQKPTENHMPLLAAVLDVVTSAERECSEEIIDEITLDWVAIS